MVWEEQNGEITKENKETYQVMNIPIFLIVVLVSQLYAYINTCYIVPLK